MKEYNVAVLGATGAVGQQMMKVLEERNFPVKRLLPLASARSAGKQLAFRGEALTIEEATEASFAGMDIVLGAVSNEMAKRFAPAIQDSGAVFIDNSSAFRLREDVPLVVPEINPEDAFQHHGIVANPNCSTIITMVALGGIRRLTAIDKMVACTYQAVSGAGQQGITELQDQLRAVTLGEPVQPHVFPCQIVSNVIPQIGSECDNGYTTEEMKMQNEGRKIMHLPELRVCCTCVRVPGHALAFHCCAAGYARSHQRGGRAPSRGRCARLRADGRFGRPQLSYAIGYLRSGSGVCRPHSPRPDQR